MTEPNPVLDEVRTARDHARALLKALQDAKAAGERASNGPGDLFKRVTGQSSLDNSIAATRRTIEAYDRVIAELDPETKPAIEPLLEPVVKPGVGPMTFAAQFASRTA